jgi:hypothetical protein
VKRLLIAIGLTIGLAGTSYAMPAGVPVSSSDTILIAGGCGAGWHRGPNGGCRRNWANPRAHACPRGYHIGPGGRCRGNGR